MIDYSIIESIEKSIPDEYLAKFRPNFLARALHKLHANDELEPY